MTRILVVDDDHAIRESVRLALATIGIETLAVDSGERALEEFPRGIFDGAIVDIIMPGINGLDTIRRLRTQAPGLPIIVSSGSLVRVGPGEPDLLRMATDLPGVINLPKPFKLSDLVRAVRTSLGVIEMSTKPAA